MSRRRRIFICSEELQFVCIVCSKAKTAGNRLEPTSKAYRKRARLHRMVDATRLNCADDLNGVPYSYAGSKRPNPTCERSKEYHEKYMLHTEDQI
jgi:hypothetical protein